VPPAMSNAPAPLSELAAPSLNSPSKALANAEASRAKGLERQLRVLEDEHHHDLERRVELERTIENARAQLRSLSSLRSADRRQVDLLRSEIDTLRGILQGQLPKPNDELKQVAAAQLVSEAKAEAAEAQLEALREQMEIGGAERARQVEELALLRAQLTSNADEKLEAQRAVAELQRALRVREQRAVAHESQAGLLQGRADAARERESRAAAQVAELRKQLEASQAEISDLHRSHAEAQSRATAAAAGTATEAASRAELKALLAAAEAQLIEQGELLEEARKKTARVEAESKSATPSAEEAAMRPALVDAVANAERAASWARAALEEEQYGRRAADGDINVLKQDIAKRQAREEVLETQVGDLRVQLRQAEAAKESARYGLEQEQQRKELGKSEVEQLTLQLELAEKLRAGHAEREAALLSELEGAKRAQADAERAVGSLQVALRAQEARALAAEQRVEDANAAMVPLRRQTEHARSSVATFEGRLSESAERLAASEARVASLQSELLHAGEVEARRSADIAADAEGQLAAARAEISGWSARQGLLLAQLEAERDTNRARSAQLLEAQESLASVKELAVTSREEQLADAHKALRAKEADAVELSRRCERLTEQLTLSREELKLRTEQQRLSAEQLRTTQESLRGRENELSLKGKLSLEQKARADGAAERLSLTAQGTQAVHSQLAEALERVARLGDELNTARANEQLALGAAAAARDDKAELEARMSGSQARLDAMGEKVRASRESRLHAQQTLEQREVELRESRRELVQLQGQLAGALEYALRQPGGVTST
jgi:hypothetical protein